MNRFACLLIATLVGCGGTQKPAGPLFTPASTEAPPTPESLQQQTMPPATPPGELPASVIDERRIAAEPGDRACVDKVPEHCHWVDLWRRHLVEQVRLPAAWLSSHVVVDFILMNDNPDMAMFALQWTLTIDWVKLPIQESIVVRQHTGAFDTDDEVLARWAGFATAGDGYHVFSLQPWTKLVPRAKAIAALASCHQASPGPTDLIEISEGKQLVLAGSAPLPKPDPYHCFAARVDLVTGKLVECGEVLCRVD
jgi:hypothetical protein